MGFLKKFFRNVYHEETPAAPASSFEALNEDQLEAHLGVSRYGSFTLSDAVRPSYALEVVPSCGFRHDTYRDEQSNRNVPVLMASASREQLFETFMELLDPLGSVVDVVLETSHDYNSTGHQDLYREHIDMPILQSILWDFEDMLVNDGCTGIAVLNPATPQEVQFDEHKLLIVYGKELRPYEQVLSDWNIPCRDDMRFITEAEHVHSTNDEYIQEFEQLKMRLGIESDY
ncbi:MAG: hypothetical protein JNL18_19120 [Planctomycetaceae bacterium]|uniref:Uncharacterized protein n=1 Tax=Lacipirellula limnantheis TaxID=2528024 RepID=A0A517TSD8_9BACT|nr:hypothetical protein [Lacipirellula limnantheis]MBL9164848.1 hypothetical protein [Planctomycetaceae bacterium]QDT71279.1 hypothetical protein I41_04350 [Lacipirellula limnantheis]